MASDLSPAFFSYCRDDSDFALRLADDLKATGADVWIDQRDIKPGEDWDIAIEAAITRCTQMLVILSPGSVKSEHVRNEVDLARGKRKTIIPVLHRDCEVPLQLRRLQRIDFRTDYERGLKELLKTLGGSPRGPASEPLQSKITEAEPRRKVLWQLAYAFLRLDQLPSGGWAKSLPGWLEALLEGPDDVVISADTRTKGGTDLTSRAFVTYIRFLRRLHFDKPAPGEPLSKRQIARAVHDNIADKIGWDGGVGVGKSGRVAHHIRHTLMGLLTFLYIYECTGRFPENISRVEEYLRNHLLEWKTDKSHPFACFCILAKVKEKLKKMHFSPAWKPAPLLDLIDTVLPEMSKFLCIWERDKKTELVPRGTCQLTANELPFQPYEGFWRMERSNLLMYLPLLVSEDGAAFNFNDEDLQDIIARELDYYIHEVASPADGSEGVFLPYHREASKDGSHPPFDFGLTAELLSVLMLPAIRGLDTLIDSNLKSVIGKNLPSLCADLEAALIQGLGRYPDLPIFRFTHSVSLGQYLEVVNEDLISVQAIRKLDDQIDSVIKNAVTESELDVLCKWIVQNAFGNLMEDHKLLVAAMRDMLVTKLVSGEHTPKDVDASPLLQLAPTYSDWQNKINTALETTISFFDGKDGLEYAERYEKAPIKTYVATTCELVEDEEYRRLKVLDMGCGPGQYAQLFNKRPKQHDVELADASIQMLRIAYEHLGKKVPSDAKLKLKLRRIENLGNDYPESEMFDIIFASSMMIHVPRHKAAEVYRQFRRLIRPGGALFVNFKIGDHTLIGIGERFHEYYRDYRVPWRMLEEAGFLVQEISMTFNEKTMYGEPTRIHWANFFCSPAESDSQRRRGIEVN